MSSTMPLNGLKVIEFAGLAPGPFCGMVLADWGASVIRIDRVGTSNAPTRDVLCRGKRSLAVNLRDPDGQKLMKTLISESHVLIDPYRPGTLEKLGLGPDVFLGNGGVNERLIYARLSGFPIHGRQKDMAGHDINYIAQSGILSMLPGTADKPTFPLNLLADFGGGGMMCALGILLALISRGTSSSGKGQVVQTDMVSGTRYLSSFPLIQALLPQAAQTAFGLGDARGTKLIDGGAPFYQIYTCKDGKWMSVGCLEPQFYRTFLELFLNALPPDFINAHGGWRPHPSSQGDVVEWPRLRDFLEAGFRLKTRDEWDEIFQGTDACTVPVLTPEEAGAAARSAIPLPHPELSATRSRVVNPQWNADSVPVLIPGEHSEEILREMNLGSQFNSLLSKGIVDTASTKSKL
ncbi:CoA-transferase family III [Schizopora paradoxa]|uniref:CoA-transferase family III n=1 Tax=Schizopora paradoxa TaxID=27342 RepID=A0A0H2RZA0_9AGAM|nr:CoA-transferase family III [Schizopora paradoxa]